MTDHSQRGLLRLTGHGIFQLSRPHCAQAFEIISVGDKIAINSTPQKHAFHNALYVTREVAELESYMLVRTRMATTTAMSNPWRAFVLAIVGWTPKKYGYMPTASEDQQ
jgi:hypothetical protein